MIPPLPRGNFWNGEGCLPPGFLISTMSVGWAGLRYSEELPPDLDMVDIRGKLSEEDYTPYVSSASFLKCARSSLSHPDVHPQIIF